MPERNQPSDRDIAMHAKARQLAEEGRRVLTDQDILDAGMQTRIQDGQIVVSADTFIEFDSDLGVEAELLADEQKALRMAGMTYGTLEARRDEDAVGSDVVHVSGDEAPKSLADLDLEHTPRNPGRKYSPRKVSTNEDPLFRR